MERVSAKIRQAIDRGDTYWSDEYRFIKKDGSIAMVYDKGLIIKDDKGKPIRMVGGMMDMTEMKKAQETISLQSKKLEEHSFVISHKIRSALSRILGLSSLYEYDLSKDELININNHLVSSSRELDLIIKELAHKIQEDKR
jgi:signal transduction histidine kinase